MPIPGNASLPVTFTLSLPTGVVPGDYYCAIVVSGSAGQQTSTSGASVAVRKRIALVVKLTIPGAVNFGLHVGQLSVTDAKDGKHFALTLGNTGNVTYVFQGTLAIRDDHGHVVPTLPLSPSGIYVIPGGVTALTAVWPNPPAFGQYQAVATLSATVGSTPHGPFTSNALSLSFFPWAPVIQGAIALLALLLFLLLSWRWWRDRLRALRADIALFRQVRARNRVAASPVEPVSTLAGRGVDDERP